MMIFKKKKIKELAEFNTGDRILCQNIKKNVSTIIHIEAVTNDLYAFTIKHLEPSTMNERPKRAWKLKKEFLTEKSIKWEILKDGNDFLKGML